jgi:hypothetical protein
MIPIKIYLIENFSHDVIHENQSDNNQNTNTLAFFSIIS